jgi:hypothetical protein
MAINVERKTCKKCGNPMLEVVPDKLYRCSVCNLYQRIRPEQPAASPPSTSPQARAEVKEAFLPLTGELKIFAERVINTLCPREQGYSPVIVREVRAIGEVLEGRRDFAEWFTKIRQMLSLKNYQLAKTLYDCLEGLRSQEAKELREQWGSFIQAEMKGYGLG